MHTARSEDGSKYPVCVLSPQLREARDRRFTSMKVRRVWIGALMLGVAGIVVPSAAGVQAGVTEYAHIPGQGTWGAVSIRFGATSTARTQSDGGAPARVARQILCVHVRDEARKRYEFGCGAVSITVDSLLTRAAITGTVPTVVRVLNQSKQVARSRIRFAADMPGTGEMKPMKSWGHYACAHGIGDDVAVVPYVATFRTAAGSVSFRSDHLGAFFSRPVRQGFIYSWTSPTAVAGPIPVPFDSTCV